MSESLITAVLEPFVEAALKVGAGVACGVLGLLLFVIGIVHMALGGGPVLFGIGLVLLVIARLLIWPLPGTRA